jgi:hypothetical protein
MLMPAGVLIVLLLGALAVDAAVVFLGERELADLTAAAANDAVTVALAPEDFYRCGALQVDASVAREVAATVVTARASDSVVLTGLDVSVDSSGDAPQVTVAATGTVDLVFTPAMPGADRTRVVAARSAATPRAPGLSPVGACEATP